MRKRGDRRKKGRDRKKFKENANLKGKGQSCIKGGYQK